MEIRCRVRLDSTRIPQGFHADVRYFLLQIPQGFHKDSIQTPWDSFRIPWRLTRDVIEDLEEIQLRTSR